MASLKHLLCGLICLIPIIAIGQIYEYTDSHGNTVFTDKPVEGAKPVKVKDPQRFPTQAVEEPSQTPMTVKPEITINNSQYYKVLRIVTPVPDDTIRNNIGLIDVVIEVEPELRGGDRVVLYLDGQNAGESKSAREFTLQNIDRGTHVIQFKVIDSKGKEVGASSRLTIHVHRQHLGELNMFNKNKPVIVIQEPQEGTLVALLDSLAAIVPD